MTTGSVYMRILQNSPFPLQQLPEKIRSLRGSRAPFQISSNPFPIQSKNLLRASQVWSVAAATPRPTLWAVSPWPPIFFPSWTKSSLRSDLSSTWTLRSTARPSDVSWWNSSAKPCQEPLKTSGHYAQVIGRSKMASLNFINTIFDCYHAFLVPRIISYCHKTFNPPPRIWKHL